MLAPAEDTWRSNPRMMARPLTSLAMIILALPSIALGQADPIVARGVQYLKTAGGGGAAGEAARAARSRPRPGTRPRNGSCRSRARRGAGIITGTRGARRPSR